MNHIVAILILMLINSSCIGQNTYYSPSGTIDKAEEFKEGKNVWIELGNKERIDGYTRIGDSIFGGEIACNVEPLQGIDIKTFKVLAGSQYAKDSYHVYFPIEIHCMEYVDCGVCYYGKFIVERANPKTFKYLGKEYGTDGHNVYFRGKLIQNADGQTFKVIDGPEYFYFATDKSNVYKHDKIFEKADPRTFYFDKNDSRTIDKEFEHKYVIGDENNEWLYTPPYTIEKIKKK